jgi:hypothetical protein
MLDYHNQPISIGDTVKNIESGWRGVIQSTEEHNGDLLLVCSGVNWWTGELDDDDTQWHAPADVVRQRQQAPDPDDPPAPGNFM